ncbi:hypothetical protein OGAPHI_005314 [Ogataea philodendri]|uniref:Conserved oligomeric Golgi complex subunit 3 n=1 Tax=Ogataea philodendri TaxID=1378263 RepID=A0A9P8P1F2_9ASCO|nr:uncharacterized protein OGAPHI_005314 [Ogataea philodendri]KAH3663324.1 hypothetical protein OGAPHI_005314 [Ogataea philodendri]
MRRRGSSVSDNKTRRSRAGSVASTTSLGAVTVDSIALEQKKPRGRSKSLTSVPSSTVDSDVSITFPLSTKERQQVWESCFTDYNNDFLLSVDDQWLIDESTSHEVLEFQSYLKYNHKENKGFLDETNAVIRDLNKLLVIGDQVTLQTVDFQTKSTQLIEEIDQMDTLHQELAKNLTVFESLDPIVQTLNTSSSVSIVTKDSFRTDILEELDKCLDFVHDPKNSSYKEISAYKHRFKQCMIRALSLVRNYINTGIRELEADLQQRINEKKKESGMISASVSVLVDAVVYIQFEHDLVEYKPCFEELYKRAVKMQDSEYLGLLNDCYNQYFKSRSNLLNPIIQQHVAAQDTSKDCIQLAQSNIAYFIKTMEREYEMFKNLFLLEPSKCTEEVDNSTNMLSLTKWFEQLLDPLYYLLRNKIIRENSISELCELISILQNYFDVEDLDNSTRFDESDMYHHEAPLQEKIQLGELFRPILEDTQTRLVFRVQVYVDKFIVSYKKTGRELTIGHRRKLSVDDPINDETLTRPDRELDRGESIFSLDNTALTPENLKFVYPPIVNAVKLLMKIYQLLNQGVFDDLANAVVHLSILSMHSNFGTVPGVEAKLYEIKSLMFLREYIATFEIEHARRETELDFSGIQKLFNRFIRGQNTKSDIDNNFSAAAAEDPDENRFFNLLLGTVPKVVNDFVDCRYEIQMALRNAVHEFINESAKPFVTPLETYPEQPLKKVVDKFMRTLKNELPRLKPRILLYLEDDRILNFLLDGIQENVIKAYETFYSKAESEKSRDVEYLLDVDVIISMWADLVSEMIDLDDPELVLDVYSDDDEYDNMVSENGDVSNLNLDSFRQHDNSIIR